MVQIPSIAPFFQELDTVFLLIPFPLSHASCVGHDLLFPCWQQGNGFIKIIWNQNFSLCMCFIINSYYKIEQALLIQGWQFKNANPNDFIRETKFSNTRYHRQVWIPNKRNVMSLVEKAAAVTHGSVKINETLVSTILSEAAKLTTSVIKLWFLMKSQGILLLHMQQKSTTP